MRIWNRLNTFCFIRYAYFLGLPGHLKFFQGHFVFQRDTVGYFHGRPREGQIGHFPPGSWTKNQKVLENLKLASRFRLNWFYLPAWHSHCTRARTEDVLIHETSFLVQINCDMIRLCGSLLWPLLLNDQSSMIRRKKMKAIPSRRFPQ